MITNIYVDFGIDLDFGPDLISNHQKVIYNFDLIARVLYGNIGTYRSQFASEIDYGYESLSKIINSTGKERPQRKFYINIIKVFLKKNEDQKIPDLNIILFQLLLACNSNNKYELIKFFIDEYIDSYQKNSFLYSLSKFSEKTGLEEDETLLYRNLITKLLVLRKREQNKSSQSFKLFTNKFVEQNQQEELFLLVNRLFLIRSHFSQNGLPVIKISRLLGWRISLDKLDFQLSILKENDFLETKHKLGRKYWMLSDDIEKKSNNFIPDELLKNELLDVKIDKYIYTNFKGITQDQVKEIAYIMASLVIGIFNPFFSFRNFVNFPDIDIGKKLVIDEYLLNSNMNMAYYRKITVCYLGYLIFVNSIIDSQSVFVRTNLDMILWTSFYLGLIFMIYSIRFIFKYTLISDLRWEIINRQFE